MSDPSIHAQDRCDWRIRRHDRQRYTTSGCWAISRYRSSTDYNFSAESTPRQWFKFVPRSASPASHIRTRRASRRSIVPRQAVSSSANPVPVLFPVVHTLRSNLCIARLQHLNTSLWCVFRAASLIVKSSRCSKMLPLIPVSSNSLVRVSAWTLPSPDRACELLTPSNLLPQKLTPLCALDSRGHS